MKARLRNREVKVCPLVLRNDGESFELLLFEHPLAGVQLVKGTVEMSDDSLESAALRELKEESGISSVSTTRYLSSWESGYQNQLWHFVLCDVSETLPAVWSFYTQDDGGHEFSFFWHKLGNPINLKCHKLFSDAIKQVEILCL
ncbi:NUDIX hydrolase [Vibrio alfacsensis]|uniref:NUDIX hydrolase n=1 Tax=Vibrio alfacsensis TaxID=1074311 RepID=UPI0040694F32